MSKDKTEV